MILGTGEGSFITITKRAMVKKDYKELDEAIKSKIPPYLYNDGQGKMVPIAHLSMLRNRDRPTRKQFQVIKDLGESAFNFVFEGSDLLAKVTEGLDPVKCVLQGKNWKLVHFNLNLSLFSTPLIQGMLLEG